MPENGLIAVVAERSAANLIFIGRSVAKRSGGI
jgi:hypothetical protein